MFLDKLGYLKRFSLEKYLQKGNFEGYDFFIELDNIRNGRDLLEFLNLFIENGCFEKNINILKNLVSSLYKKSIIIIYEAILLKKDKKFNSIFVDYKDIYTVEKFDYENLEDLLKISKEILDDNKNEIIIYNSINNKLHTKTNKEYYNLILQLLETKYKLNYREVKHILGLLIFSSNKRLKKDLEDLVDFLLNEYDIELTNDYKYLYSLGYKLINGISDKDIDFKILFIKNMLNYIGKVDFFEKISDSLKNEELKDYLYEIILSSFNNKTDSLLKIKNNIKKSIKEDKVKVNKMIKNFKNNLEKTEVGESIEELDSLIDNL